MAHIPKYKESEPNKKFRKDPYAYLNQQAWGDEIISDNENGISDNGSIREDGLVF